jgi:hypothetical protein
VVHSIVPLAVLEAVKNLDTPVEDGLAEFADELLVKRLGLSSTVQMQLTEFEQLVRKDARVDRRTSKRCCAWWDGGRTPTSYSRMPGAARRGAP